jgi:hypothetical protein
MSTRQKPIFALTAAVVFSFLSVGPSLHAQSILVDQGTSTLANVFLTPSGPEDVSVSWFVVENTTSDLFTYAYNVNNPVGDVQLNIFGQPISPAIPETFDSFTLTFNTALPGAYVSGTIPVNGTLAVTGSTVTWTFPAVSPGSSSELLAFQSSVPPALGIASVGGGATPPSPWSSVPGGQQVDVPRAVPEPEVTSMFALAALGLLPFSKKWRTLVSKSLDSQRYF